MRQQAVLFSILTLLTLRVFASDPVNYDGIWETPLNEEIYGMKIQGVNAYVISGLDAVWIAHDSVDRSTDLFFAKVNRFESGLILSNYSLVQIHHGVVTYTVMEDFEQFDDTLYIGQKGEGEIGITNHRQLGVGELIFKKKEFFNHSFAISLDSALNSMARSIREHQEKKDYPGMASVFRKYMMCFSLYEFAGSGAAMNAHAKDYVFNVHCIFPFFWNGEQLSALDEDQLTRNDPSEDTKCKVIANLILKPDDAKIVSYFESLFE